MSSPDDRQAADRLAQFLRNAGLEVLTSPSAGPIGAVVALLSPSALADPTWRRVVDTVSVARVVPVRLQALDDAQVPARVQQIHWIDWDSDAPQTTFGSVLAALHSDPARHRIAHQLALEAQAWAGSKYSESALVSDPRRVAEMQRVITEIEWDPLLRPAPLTFDYVARCGRLSRARRSRRIATRVVVIGTVVVVAAVTLAVLPGFRQLGRSNRSTVSAMPDEFVAQELPAWTAMLSGSLLLNGDDRQVGLARRTLESTLVMPWPTGRIATGPDTQWQSFIPYAGGTRAAVIATPTGGSEHFGVLDVTSGQFLWHVPLNGNFEGVAVSRDERTAATAGADGVRVIDLADHHVDVVSTDPTGGAIRLADDGTIVTNDEDGTFETFTDGERSVVGAFEDWLDFRTTSDGGVRALIRRAPGSYVIIDALTGEMLAEATMPVPVIEAGALLPDQLQAIVVGADEQLWSIQPGQAPLPTGISVSQNTTMMAGLSGGRVVVGGPVERPSVFHLASGVDLGVVCRDTPSVDAVVPALDEAAIACSSPGLGVVWPLPEGPLPTPRTAMSREPADRSGRLSITAQGGDLLLTLGDDSRHRLPVTVTEVRALALSPDADRLLAASSSGEVAVVDLTGPELEVVVATTVPDHSAAVAVGWDDVGPIVSTAAGATWRVPDCAGCGTERGLLTKLIETLSGCWTETQLADVDGDARDRLRLQICGEFSDVEAG